MHNKIITGIGLLCALFIATQIRRKQHEPFTQPIESIHVLLDKPIKQPVNTHPVNYGGLNKHVYQTPMASYAQVTNHKRYWNNPENGTALLPSINGTSLYT